ncbi:MAG: glycosyltransferase [Bacilli bacterium]|nr:glycosyltransferase [Bacilli bacterium]
METNYQISVIIPVYNGEKYIENALNSVFQQTFPSAKTEIIVIDDGSNDKTKEIVKKCFKNRNNTKYTTNKRGKGVSSARNYGMLLAKAPYICFLDADDEMTPRFLEITYNEIIKNKVDIVRTSVVIEENGKIIVPKDPRPKQIYTNKDITQLVLSHLEPWGALYRKNMLIKNNVFFNEKVCIFESFSFSINALLNAKKTLLLPKFAGTFWYIKPTGLHTTLTQRKDYDTLLKVLKDMIHVLIEHHQPKICIDIVLDIIMNGYAGQMVTSPVDTREKMKFFMAKVTCGEKVDLLR